MAIRPLLLKCAIHRNQCQLCSCSRWPISFHGSSCVRWISQRKRLTVLAIETSCDDTSVAILNRYHRTKQQGAPQWDTLDQDVAYDVTFHEKVTADNDAYNGIHPLVALESHRRNLARLVQRALEQLRHRSREREDLAHDALSEGSAETTASVHDHGKASSSWQPDLVAVTRGPGMRSNLAVGLDTAKGLAVALNAPFIGVHHMQAHGLTPRLVYALEQSAQSSLRESGILQPSFPFLSVLVSGGHTLLIDSTGLTNHSIAAETQDIAIGDCLDKAARAILPATMLKAPFGKALEELAFHTKISASIEVGPRESVTQDLTSQKAANPAPVSMERCEPSADYDYSPPARRQDELEHKLTQWGWSLGPPLSESNGRERSSRRMMFSFTGLLSFVERIMKYKIGPHGTLTTEPRGYVSLQERQTLARELQRIAFEHLASRIMLYLESKPDWEGDTVVVSGGVASNRFLRHLLRSVLDVRGYSHVRVSFPPIELCTDNALMIAWAGLEMYEAGYTSDLSIGPIRKWSMDPEAEDGGILGAEGWMLNK